MLGGLAEELQQLIGVALVVAVAERRAADGLVALRQRIAKRDVVPDAIVGTGRRRGQQRRGQHREKREADPRRSTSSPVIRAPRLREGSRIGELSRTAFMSASLGPDDLA